MRAFVPPFRFTSFFSPEDSLLCMIAAEAALAHARTMRRLDGRSIDPLRVAELTTGSGLAGMHILRLEHGSRLMGLDVDEEAVNTARHNARLLGLSERVVFDCADLWSGTTAEMLDEFQPQLMICNPPYIPEPESGSLQIEAGAGADGTAHLRRTIELADTVGPRALALSWCSVSDPGEIVRMAGRAGYFLNSLFVVAISDGEYSGTVHSYLRTLGTAFVNEDPATLREIAPDDDATFAYLLFAGDFSRERRALTDAGDAVERISRDFQRRGLAALETPDAPVPVRAWLLDRWDELRLRALLHGDVNSMEPNPVVTERYG